MKNLHQMEEQKMRAKHGKVVVGITGPAPAQPG